MAEKKPEGQGEPKKSVNMKLLMLVAYSVLNVAVSGLGAFWVYSSTIGWHPPVIEEATLASLKAKEDAKPITDEPLIYTMDKFTVNLDGEPKRTIRMELNLEMLSKEGFEEIINTENRAKARDRVVRLLNGKTFDEVESIQGKLFLKDELIRQFNHILDKGVVKDIYFSEFVVQ